MPTAKKTPSPPPPPPTPMARLKDHVAAWQRLPVPKQMLVIVILVVGFSLVFAVLKVSWSGELASVTSGTRSYSVADKGVSMESPFAAAGVGGATQGVAGMDGASVGTDAGVSSTVLPAVVPNVAGGTGLYDERSYEARAYTLRYRTAQFDPTCDSIESLRPRVDVVFLQSDRTDTSCVYQFKVAQAVEPQVLDMLKALGPEQLTTDVTSLKEQQVRHESEMDILLQTNETLKSRRQQVVSAYDQYVALATSAGKIDGMPQATRDHLALLAQIDQQQLTVSKQIDQLSRTMAQIQDRIDYARFNVRVDKFDVVNMAALRDSWRNGIVAFTARVNAAVEALTLGLLSTLLSIAEIVVYLLLVLLIAKHGWPLIRDYWKAPICEQER